MGESTSSGGGRRATPPDKVPTYRTGDIVLCKGKVERSAHDDSVYVRFGESGQCPQLTAADIAKVVKSAIRIGDRIRWWESTGNRSGEVLAVNPDDNGGVGDPKVWLWVREDGKWPRVTVEAGEVTRL